MKRRSLREAAETQIRDLQPVLEQAKQEADKLS
jgi:hypothetical protein